MADAGEYKADEIRPTDTEASVDESIHGITSGQGEYLLSAPSRFAVTRAVS